MSNNPGANNYQNLRDQNRVTVASGQSNADATQSLPFLVDHVTGRLLVDSSGGSVGLSLLLPTSGVVNGVNRVFVFPATPQIIVLDNGNTMNQQNITPDLTQNWTGTTTVTLNQSPLFNIYGLG